MSSWPYLVLGICVSSSLHALLYVRAHSRQSNAQLTLGRSALIISQGVYARLTVVWATVRVGMRSKRELCSRKMGAETRGRLLITLYLPSLCALYAM